MTCEKAEDYLSAYLDDMLDPQLRQEIETHLHGCASCREVLAEYRRYDELLVSVPRVAPSAELRDRIFQSSEVAALIRKQGGRPESPSHGLSGEPRDGRATSADPMPARVRSSSPPWKRVALQSAAVLALLLGSALLIKQGLLHSGTTSGHGSVLTIAGPHDKAPLSAGNRAVYERGGALWSVPESGPDLARQLTPAGVTVTGWAVSPNGQQIAYTDTAGRIHVIRSDDQSDSVIGRVDAAPLSSGFWTTAAGRDVSQSIVWSPDGGRIAYDAADAAGRLTLHVMSSSGAKDVSVSTGAASAIAAPIWNADGSRLAFVETVGGSEHVGVFDTASGQAQIVAAHADPADAAATFTRLAWGADSSAPSLTWAASDGNAITGVFAQAATSGEATRLSPSGMQYTAADYSAHGSGQWVVASGNTNGTLSVLVPVASGADASVATTSSPIARAAWSPDGTTVAYLTKSGQLGLWSPGNTPVTVASNVSSLPVWSPDSSRFAVQVSDGVLSVRVANGQPTVLSRLVTTPSAVILSWAPDNQGLVVSSTSGVIVAAVNGNVKVADSLPADGTAVVWTVAR